ncbi:DUF6906 family protein [Paenibacillus terrae]|uniref:DUF6906 family protein n=1 Tax=Paenibacillus terrae TaxID=159743 RepID=UPI00148523A4|nr:hypothetical protein [Paenibacillus terrae]
MKNGKKPTLRQQNAIWAAKLIPSDWLVYKAGPFHLHIVHRENKQTHIISTGKERTN